MKFPRLKGLLEPSYLERQAGPSTASGSFGLSLAAAPNKGCRDSAAGVTHTPPFPTY